MKHFLKRRILAMFLSVFLVMNFCANTFVVHSLVTVSSVTADVSPDGDAYHIMQLAQGAGISGNILSGKTYNNWNTSNVFTKEFSTLHDGSLNYAYKLVNADKNGQCGIDVPMTVSEMPMGTYTFSAWSKADNVLKHDAPAGLVYSYSLMVQLQFTDGKYRSYGAEFSMGTHGWEYRDVSFTVDKPLQSVCIYAFLRQPCTGTAWFDELTLKSTTSSSSTFHNMPVQVMRTSPVQTTEITLSTNDGLSLGLGASTVTSLKVNNVEKANNAYSGFLVRDVAQSNGVYAFAPSTGSSADAFKGAQSTLGLNIEANYTAQTNHIAVSGKIKETAPSTDGRAVQLSFALPITASGWHWGDDIQTNRTVTIGAAKDVFKRLGDSTSSFSVTDWDSAPHSMYPTSTIYNDDLGIAIATSMDFPTYWELEYNGSTGQYVITYQLGIVNEAPDAARFSFVIYKLDDHTWGFRSAMEKYTKIFPNYYTVREKEQGLWIAAPTDYSNIPNIKDFNIRFNEESNSRDKDYVRNNGIEELENGIKGYCYVEPGSWWISDAEATQLSTGSLKDPTTTDKVLSAITELSNLSDPKKLLTRMAKPTVAGAECLDLNGLLLWDPVNTPWATDGVQIHGNFNPNLPEPNFYSAYLNSSQWGNIFDPLKSIAYPYDGIYLDELSGWWTGNANFNENQYQYTTVPLTYSPYYKKPMLHRSTTTWEFVKKMSDEAHAIGKTVFANKSPDKVAYFTPLVDAMGTEAIVWSGSSYSPPSLETMSQWRTLAYQKPYNTLFSVDYNTFNNAYMERYIQYCLLFGIFPSPHNSLSEGGGATYFNSSQAWYERDRTVWQKYMPALKTIAQAGWEPVTRATANNSNVLVERYGQTAQNGVYFSVHNTSSSAQTVTVTIPTSNFGVTALCEYRELTSGNTYSLQNNTYSVTLNPYQTIVLGMKNLELPGIEQYTATSFANEVLEQMGDTANTYPISTTTSPWNSATYITAWDKQNQAYGPFYNAYIMNSTAVYADTGISVFLSKGTPGLFWLNPGATYDSWIGVHNVALSFTAPQDGNYTFSADDINNTLATNFTNKSITGATTTVDAGVRIVVDSQKIWPVNNDWQIIAPDASVPIPTIADIAMTQGQEIRIEVKAAAKAAANYLVQVTASGKMTYTGPKPVFNSSTILCPSPNMFSLPITFSTATDAVTSKGNLTYEVFVGTTAFGNSLPTGTPIKTLSNQTADTATTLINPLSSGTDYYIAILATDEGSNKSFIKGGPFRTATITNATNLGARTLAYDVLSQMGNAADYYSISATLSPWNSATYINAWDKQNRAYGPFYNNYIMNSTVVYADNGISVFANKTTPGLFFMNPGSAYAGWIGNHNVALSFTAPRDGLYTFSADDLSDTLAQNFTNKTMTGANSTSDVGVRITVNGQKIWPSASDWQVIAPGASVPIPTISNVAMSAGQELKVESRAYQIAQYYELQVSASAKMVYNDVIITDVTAPGFISGSISCATPNLKVLPITFPTATDDITAKGGIVYDLFVSTSDFGSTMPNGTPVMSISGLMANTAAANLINLNSGTNYYVAVVAKDTIGNKSFIKAGPFATLSNIPVTGISLDKSSAPLQRYATLTLTATVSPSNATKKTINWSSSNTAVATVNSIGYVIGVSLGTATITATTVDGSFTASCTVTVKRYDPTKYYKITYDTNTTLSMDTTTTGLNGVVKNVTYTGANSQLWQIIETTDANTFKIVNKATGYALKVNSTTNSTGKQIIQTNYASANNMNFTINASTNYVQIVSKLGSSTYIKCTGTTGGTLVTAASGTTTRWDITLVP